LDTEPVQVVTIDQTLLERGVAAASIPLKGVGLQTPRSTLSMRSDDTTAKHEDRNDGNFHDRTGSSSRTEEFRHCGHLSTPPVGRWTTAIIYCG